MKPSLGAEAVPILRSGARLADFVELTKPRIALLVLFTVAAGGLLAPGGALNITLLVHTLIGTNRPFATVTEPPSMRNLLVKLWRDESAVTSPEWAFIVTILVLGAVTGLVASRQAKVQTFDEPAIVRGK